MHSRTKTTSSCSVELGLARKNYVHVVHTAWKTKSSNNCTIFHESTAVMAINANGWSLIKTTLLLLQQVHNAVIENSYIPPTLQGPVGHH